MSKRTKSSSSKSRPNFESIRLAVEYVATRRVWMRHRQLKEHTQGQVRRLADAIDRIGFNVPVLVDDDLALVSGYGRLKAAKLLGLAEVPVIRVTHLNDEQLRLFAIFDNKIAEQSDWIEDALALEFDELFSIDTALDLSDSGFAIAEIDAFAGRAKTAALSDLDRVVEPDQTITPVTRLGDIWQCGRHRLICGDSTDPGVIARLTDGAKITQVVADPPFDLPTRAFSSTGRHGNFVMGAGEMGAARFTDFLTRFLNAAKPVLIDGAWVFAFMDHKHIAQLLAAGEQAGMSYAQLLVWVKGQAGLGSFYRSGHELVGVFRHGTVSGRNNIMLGAHGRNRSNVLNYPGVMGKSGGGKRALHMHPTVKNLAMIADLLLDASAPGDAILDSFGGSGTTMIAAEKTDRTAYLCELSPGYADVIVQRYNDLGTTPALLAMTGQSFAEMRAERATTTGEAA